MGVSTNISRSFEMLNENCDLILVEHTKDKDIRRHLKNCSGFVQSSQIAIIIIHDKDRLTFYTTFVTNASCTKANYHY